MKEPLPEYIVGLGNPGKKYTGTRHNIGARLVAAVEEFCDTERRFKRYKGHYAELTFEGRRFSAFRPRTYMNNSGRAVQALASARGIEPQNLLIIADCVDLPFGKLRLRKKGGSGGHRGLQSIIDCLGTTDFPRLRVGLSREEEPNMVNFVLGEWTREEERALQDNLKTMVNVVLSAVACGMDTAMNRYNNVNPLITSTDVEQNKEATN